MNLQPATPRSENLVASTLGMKRGSLGQEEGDQGGKTGHLNLPLKEEEARRFQGKKQCLQSQRRVKQSGKVGKVSTPTPAQSCSPFWLLSLPTLNSMVSSMFQKTDTCHPDCLALCLFCLSPLLGLPTLPQAAGICWIPDKAWEVSSVVPTGGDTI